MALARRTALVSAALAILALVAHAPNSPLAASADAAVPKNFVGIVSDDAFAGTADYRAQTFATQQAAGIGMIRRTFDWAEIERQPDQYDFSAYDSFVAAAAEHQIEVLPVLFNPPEFRSGRPSSHPARGTYFPKHYSDLGVFGAVVAKRYGRNGTFWTEHPEIPKLPITAYQVWNEPNLAAYSPPRPSAKKYVALLKATATKIRGVDRRAEIVTAGLPDSKLSKPDVYKFITQMYQAGAKGSFNTLAINPYVTSASKLLTKLKRIHEITRRFRDKRAKLWATEIGWSDNGPRSPFRVGAAGQAKLIKQSLPVLGRARSSLGMRGFFYFSWRDAPPYAPLFRDFWGLHTGLLRMDGSAKPAFTAFKQAVAALHPR